MKKFTHLEKLNFVLEKLGKDHLAYEDVLKRIAFEPPLEYDEYHLRLALNKLKKDGYIDYMVGNRFSDHQEPSEGIEIRTNYNGYIFLEAGGYVQEAINNKTNSDWIRTLQTRQDQMATRMFRVNLCIAVATGIAAVYYFADLEKNYGWFHWSFCEWLIFAAACVSLFLIVYIAYTLLTQEREQKKKQST